MLMTKIALWIHSLLIRLSLALIDARAPFRVVNTIVWLEKIASDLSHEIFRVMAMEYNSSKLSTAGGVISVDDMKEVLKNFPDAKVVPLTCGRYSLIVKDKAIARSFMTPSGTEVFKVNSLKIHVGGRGEGSSVTLDV